MSNVSNCVRAFSPFLSFPHTRNSGSSKASRQLLLEMGLLLVNGQITIDLLPPTFAMAFKEQRLFGETYSR